MLALSGILDRGREKGAIFFFFFLLISVCIICMLVVYVLPSICELTILNVVASLSHSL